MSGFVERIGDSVALVSPDGSAHDPDLLMVEALDAMVLAADADAAASEISIAVPAYWKPGTVQALRNGLRTHLGFVRSGMAPRLVSDAIAALTAANAELCLAATGVVGLLDFGGAGTSATLVSLAGDFELVTPTMRYAAFSGDEIDHALMLKVFEELGHGSGIDPASTAGVGQLGLLREQCREAKERLSTETVAEFAAELGGRRCSMKLTRDELGDLIQDRLSGFIYAFDDMLARHKKSWADLSALVAVGGGASIPLVTERLSVYSRRPVVSPSQPAYAAALGALLLASRGEARDLRTRTSIGLLTAAAGEIVELPAGDVLVIDDEALTDRELAWSQTEYRGDVRVPYSPDVFDEDGPAGWSMRLNVIEPPRDNPWRRVRLSQLIIGMCAVVAMTAVGRRGLHVVGHRKPPGTAGAHRRAPAGAAGQLPGAKPDTRRLRRPCRRRPARNRCPARRRRRPHRAVAATAAAGDRHHAAAAGRDHEASPAATAGYDPAADHDGDDHHPAAAAADDDAARDGSAAVDPHDDGADDDGVDTRSAATGADTGSGAAEPGSQAPQAPQYPQYPGNSQNPFLRPGY